MRGLLCFASVTVEQRAVRGGQKWSGSPKLKEECEDVSPDSRLMVVYVSPGGVRLTTLNREFSGDGR